MSDITKFKACATCKADIGFGEKYFQCSVSTCQRRNTDFAFCTQECWDAHVPTFRHKDAWAIHVTSPSLVEWQAHQRAVEGEEVERKAEAAKRVIDVPTPMGELREDEVLVVASKLKAYIKAKSGMNTSGEVMDVLSQRLRKLCDEAILRAQQAGRKTVLDRDF